MISYCWVKDGKVKFEKTLSGSIFILEDDVVGYNAAIYARVSSSKNQDNLERQKERLISYCNAKFCFYY